MIDKFIKFLKDNNVLDKFNNNLDPIEKPLDKFLANTDPQIYIGVAFDWGTTPEGVILWGGLYSKWVCEISEVAR